MTSTKFSIPLLGDDNLEEDDFKVNSGSLFKTHRQQIQNNILLSKSPQKTTLKQEDNTGKHQSSNLIEANNCTKNKVPSSSYLKTNDSSKPSSSAVGLAGTNQQSFKNAKTQSIKEKGNGPTDSIITRNVSACDRITSAESSSVKFLPTSSAGLPQSKESVLKLSPIRPGGSSKTSLIVSARQRGNPIIKFIRNVPWEYGDIVPDYEMGKTMCALFLSLRYHHLNPAYIHERLKQLGRSYDLRIILVQVDVKDPHHSLTELAKIAILSDATLIVAFSPEEAGRYLETYKAYENKPPDLIMEKTEGDFLSQFTDCVTCTRKVNKTDAMTLLNTFGSFQKVVQADEEDLSLCPGFGPQKAKRLYEILQEPFLKANKRIKKDTTQKKKDAAPGKVEPQPSTSGLT